MKEEAQMKSRRNSLLPLGLGLGLGLQRRERPAHQIPCCCYSRHERCGDRLTHSFSILTVYSPRSSFQSRRLLDVSLARAASRNFGQRVLCLDRGDKKLELTESTTCAFVQRESKQSSEYGSQTGTVDRAHRGTRELYQGCHRVSQGARVSNIIPSQVRVSERD